MSSEKVFRLVRDDKDTQETILMYNRLDYTNATENRISKCITSTEFFKYQGYFSVQVSDFLHYKYMDSLHQYYEEFLIVIYGMSSQKIYIN